MPKALFFHPDDQLFLSIFYRNKPTFQFFAHCSGLSQFPNRLTLCVGFLNG